MERTMGVANKLTTSLDRMSSVFNTGLGIGTAIGGFALLEKAFTRSIEKAKLYQTSQLAIAASIQSAYKISDSGGKEVGGYRGFEYARDMSGKLNQIIIQRQARNILTYEEELGAFQSSISPGARKGLTPMRTLLLSEQSAIVAKTLGLRGEEIANASRLLMGGGVNVGRSTIGRALGVTNADIQGKSGDELEKYLFSKMKGFKAAEPDFAKSIEGIISTLEAKFDVFFSKIGGKFMKALSPKLEELGALFEGPEADKLASTLTDMFLGIFKGIESIVKSPAIPQIMKFLSFLASYGDKIVIGAVLYTLLQTIVAVTRGMGELVGWFKQMEVGATTSARAVTSLAAATRTLSMSGGGGMVPGVMPARGAATPYPGADAAPGTYMNRGKIGYIDPVTKKFMSQSAGAAMASSYERQVLSTRSAANARMIAEGSEESFLTGQMALGGMAGGIGRKSLFGELPGTTLGDEAAQAGMRPGFNFMNSVQGQVLTEEQMAQAGLSRARVYGRPSLRTQLRHPFSAQSMPTFSAIGQRAKGFMGRAAGVGGQMLQGGMYGMMGSSMIEMGSESMGLNQSAGGNFATNVASGAAMTAGLA
jgi:hypothetical protein